MDDKLKYDYLWDMEFDPFGEDVCVKKLNINEIIENSLENYVYHSNTYTIRSEIKRRLELTLEQTDGIKDFCVICDETNNIPYLIDIQRCSVDIYYKDGTDVKNINVLIIPSGGLVQQASYLHPASPHVYTWVRALPTLNRHPGLKTWLEEIHQF